MTAADEVRGERSVAGDGGSGKPSSREAGRTPPDAATAAGAGSAGGRRTVVLAGMPGLGGVYARGLASSGRVTVARRLGRAAAVLPDVAHEVRGVQATAAHLTDYQHLLGESASDVLPAGFVHVLTFPVSTSVIARADFPLPLVGLVHLANRVEQLAPVRLGDALDVRAWTQDLRPHRSGTQLDAVAEVRSGGVLVWRGTSTYLARGVRLAGRAPDEERAPFVRPVPTARWRLGADAGRRYAAVSGDRNPIHLSALAAKAFGFPRTIAHGMYTASRALAEVGAVRGDRFVWSVDFAAPVLLPGTVDVRVAADGDGFAFAGWDGRTGRPHLTGTVTPLP